MKVIVVGAGVLGASITYQLAKRGVAVTVLDQGIPGEGASAASFAWLNSNAKELRPYHHLSVISMAEWPLVARELGSSSWLHRNGHLHVAATAVQAAGLLARAELLESSGYAAIPVAPREIPRLDPVIRANEDYQAGVFFPGEGHITVPLLIHELLDAATAHGATVRHSTKVEALLSDAESITGVVLEGGERIESDVVVVSAGAGIGGLLETQGISVRTEGTPGVTVTTSPGSSKLTTVLHVPGLSVRPDSGGRLVVRSSGIDADINLTNWTLPEPAVQALFAQLGEALTDVEPAAVRAERIRIAHRPAFDGLPAVGFWDDRPGLYVATVPTGVTLGAVTGRLAAEEITTGKAPKLLAGLQPGRVESMVG
ncbi:MULTISPECIES: FAD-binding oxidoreductase [Arthrobacter]|uniref:FAD-binding oxidoreductase n=1 Tax=Arthrobacter terricola TaxID=2547396 RepID=A0A4R5KEB9_9MICC|nr:MULTISPECIES: FAD-dependent oxidoreductase [Arthrobacter]MBT8159713.1 FAD-binding oxidoreductase [Arthrobacter sp. GN70]TDF93661.1 FAD-binding oxidoreductase [Arthrobacter terricola]